MKRFALATPESMTIQRSVMLVLSLLVLLFILGMWLMSSLNLRFAQDTMTELRQRQVADTFYANLDRINAHHQRMEQNTLDLARLGELYQRLNLDTGRPPSVELERNLRQILRDFPDANGSAIWLEPGVVGPEALGISAHRDDEGIRINLNRDDVRERNWYQRIRAHLDTQDQQTGRRSFNWSPAYYKSQIDTVVISLSTLMRDDSNRVIGMVSSDWQIDAIINLVSQVDITPGTFAFLLDSQNRNLSSLSRSEDVQGAQQLIEAITALQLQAGEDNRSNRLLGMLERNTPLQQRMLEVAGHQYALLYAATDADMVFGIGVPKAEIDAVLVPMRESNLRIALLIGSILLLLSALILFMVASTLRQLRNLYTDPLTGLPNREKLLVDLRQTRAASLILLNIDDFKQINDFYGHECGDQVICILAGALRQRLLEDALWASSRLYRMPGDEMAIWLPGQLSPTQQQQRLSELERFVQKLSITWAGQDLTLRTSMGMASTRQPDGSLLPSALLLASANIALKQARLSLTSHVIYDPALRARESYEHNLIWANKLKSALEQGRIVPWFQPIMTLANDRIEKFECLVRMLDEQGEPVSPAQFLPVAKKIRLYREITRQMIDQCFRHFADNDYAFSLNLSSEDLLDPELCKDILQRLENSPLAHRVILEILESEGIENYAPVRAFIDQAKALGCRIAIDDFGTGYSNFEHLLRLNVDLIKIDGSLIRQLNDDSNALTLTRGIIHFARELGMQTVAEFVHSPALLQRVRELGIDFAQGAAIGMPMADLQGTIEPQDRSAQR
ncbi:MAG: sensor domain-containing phosphodiesterase [Gammaproteobacteria bacterium HGW-Gammaproteobacteria-11]|nr:MAG: sensor domain-containing phosphodiesterase [Gammaproteobacteria bacterium HGW-Gammaproteobacteria-11]